MNYKISAAMIAVVALTGCQSGKKAGYGNNLTEGDAIPGTAEHFHQQVSDRALFSYDSSSLSSEAERNLSDAASWSKKYPSVNLIVEGHTDPRGTREYNLALGERRAIKVEKYLKSRGVNAKIRHVSYGKDRLPAGANADSRSYARNRVGIVTPE